MMGQTDPHARPLAERALRLTEEEALALLELCMLARMDDNPVRDSAMTKLGEICREFIRPEIPEVRVTAGVRASGRRGKRVPLRFRVPLPRREEAPARDTAGCV